MAKTMFIIVEPIRHDGEDFPVGAELALDPVDAKPLLEWKAIVDKKTFAAAEAEAKAAAEAEAKAAAEAEAKAAAEAEDGNGD